MSVIEYKDINFPNSEEETQNYIMMENCIDKNYRYDRQYYKITVTFFRGEIDYIMEKYKMLFGQDNKWHKFGNSDRLKLKFFEQLKWG